MSADHQVEGAFALADSALPHDEHAQAQDVQEDAMHHLADGEAIFQQRRQLADGGGRADVRRQQRDAGPFRLDHQIGRRREPASQQHTGDVAGKGSPQRLASSSGIEALDEANLALAVNQHASGMQILVESGQCEACLLDVRVGDVAAEAPRAGQQIEGETDRLGAGFQQTADGHGRNVRHEVRS